MTVGIFNPDDNPLKLTTAAIKHCKEEIDKASASGLRVSIKESGCSGYMYVMGFVEKPSETDLKFDVDGQLTLFVDPEAVPVIRGTQMDYVKDGLNYQVKFNNPNVQGECGCGESFTV